MRVFCDFDGTISRLDTTDLVLRHLGGEGWEELEADWVAGRITAAECMRRQIALIEGDEQALDNLLDTVPLDPGFVAFARWCASEGVPMAIVSDGVDRFIARILQRHGLDHIAVTANRLAGAPGARRLEQPYAQSACQAGSGVCKCAVTGLRGRGADSPQTIFVGDGRSDFCVAGRADWVFARDKLAAHMGERGWFYTPFSSFHDVAAALRESLRERRRAALTAAV